VEAKPHITNVKEKNMEITTGRLMHGMRVAEKMKQMAESNPAICDADANELFFLGYIHDIGYNFVSRQDGHEHFNSFR
jgi:HD-GYP domain-containing protein (c-di-GMP phosphodiesterase class II)